MIEKKYKTQSPILFLIFNRPDVTYKVFEEIRKVTPNRLYIAADGPRYNRENDDILCKEAREIVSKIDWDCKTQTLFRDENLGCKNAVSSAINWFFENEEEGIILEDDCFPNQDFFIFCDLMLDKYRYDSRIAHIGGCNLQFGKKRGNQSYYFSNLTHVWGWASWSRAWKDYDVNLKKYRGLEVENYFLSIFNNQIIAKKWNSIFQNLINDKIDTWDYQWTFTNFFNNRLSVIPNSNLIVNIGFGNNATHTFEIDSDIANMELQDIGIIEHPVVVLPEKKADLFTLYKDFQVIKEMKKSKSLFKFYKK